MMHLDPNLWHLAFQTVGILPLMGLSLLGLGGGGGLGIAGGTTSTDASSHISPTVTVNNGGGSTQTYLIIGAIALVALLLFGMFFNGHRR